MAFETWRFEGTYFKQFGKKLQIYLKNTSQVCEEFPSPNFRKVYNV